MSKLNCELASEYCKRGYERYCRKNFAGAIAEFTEAIRLRPECGSAYNNRGNIFFLLGHTQSALNDFSRAASLGYPVDAKYLQLCREQGIHPEAQMKMENVEVHMS